MIYHLFEYLEQFDFPGAGMFQYLSFRASLTIITSLVISMIAGKRIIRMLQRKQIGESVRDLGLHGQNEKPDEFLASEGARHQDQPGSEPEQDHRSDGREHFRNG